MDQVNTTHKLFSKDFISLNIMIFLAYLNLAVFFTFAPYLAAEGFRPGVIGIIISAFSLSGLVLRPLISPFLFPSNARKWIAIGTLVDIASLFLYLLAGTIVPLLILRFVHGAAYVCMAASKMALIVAFIPPKKASLAFSFTSASMLLPMAIVPPLLDPLTKLLGGFDKVLAATGVLMLVIYPLLLLIHPKDAQGNELKIKEKHISHKEYFKDLSQPKILVVLAIILVLFVCIAASFMYCAQFGAHIDVENPGLFFTIAIVMMILVRLVGGQFMDRFKASILIAGSLAILVLAYAGLAVTKGPVFFYAMAPICGFCWGVAHPVLHAVLFRISKPRLQSLNQNFGTEMVDGGFFLGPIIGAAIIGTSHFHLFFIFCAVITGLSFLGFILVLPELRKHDHLKISESYNNKY
ncbi:MAG: MFS transporter [Candidatus Cloacimonetes bacterium]|nr:MFS transporter [Candidatus Cloacimonadota bacterium]